MDKILVSACLLGEKCTYKGNHHAQAYLQELNAYYDIVPFCCEVEGGLGVPRLPSEIRGNSVVNSENKDVTDAFRLGVYKAASIVSYLGIRLAILKENSPSCGVHLVHDGYFQDRLVQGQGLLTRELTRLGVTVMNEEEGLAFLENLKKQKQIKDEKTRIAIAKENAPARKESKPEGKKFDGKKPYGKKSFDGKKSFNGKKSFGDKKSFNGKKFGEKKKDYGARKPASFNRERKKNP